MRIRTSAVLAVSALAATFVLRSVLAETPVKAPFDGKFDAYWGDQKAELAGYELIQPRYGELRKGTAVTITVTEPFSNSVRVKADDGKHPPADVFPVLKLNLVEDFQTGVYDYNLMTSVFVAMAPVNGREAGLPTKVSFGAQEWCGHAYAQTLFDAGNVRFTSHSYFDGEADENRKIDYPKAGIAEDSLLLWSRGLAAPFMQPGQKLEVPLLRSLKSTRLLHKPLDWSTATLTRGEKPETVEVPAGRFECEVRTVTAFGRTTTYYVELAHPNRVIKWTSTDGEQAALLRSERLTYWSLHKEGDEKELPKLGLKVPTR